MAWQAEVHVTGLGFPEGPVALADGSIAFVDLLHAKVRAFRDGQVRELCSLPGAPNGMRLGPDGSLYIANNGGIAPLSLEELKFAEPQIPGCLQRLGADGRWDYFATELPGAGPSRPNDLVFTPQGEIVFTDPQNWEVLGADPAAYRGGQLLVAAADGSVRHLARMTGFPNGLAFHPDGSLIVGITMEHRLVRFAWNDGNVGAMEEWCRLDDRFNPDGMVFHEDKLFVTGSGGDRIAILDTSGRLIEMIDTGPGSDPTNLCVHGGRLWVTLGLPGQLISYRL
ncbi:SMP-30/gluconolactonase/LRE family protein [Mesorhizobium sp. ANAO-SY3R2]|uniref:SMP-30/gluconolactonase/LRE family protein n=1 Tax=Mesorhizobium sp. ANAO-SY3R2 TaxID=3166644 RepID=UPI00366FE01D